MYLSRVIGLYSYCPGVQSIVLLQACLDVVATRRKLTNVHPAEKLNCNLRFASKITLVRRRDSHAYRKMTKCITSNAVIEPFERQARRCK